MERFLLVSSTFCYLLGFAWTLVAIGAHKFRPSRFNFIAISTGFLLETGFLYLRGNAIGRCPITTLFEVLVFLCWSVGVIYMIVGPTYRLSLMGAFTAPLVFFIQGFALVTLDFSPAAGIGGRPNAWLEFHAAFSIIAYGAFALAAVAGLMFLVQERQLKTHRLHSIFFLLPPIHELGLANRRLILLGVTLLTLGLGAGFLVGGPLDFSKIVWAFVVWIGYSTLFVAGLIHRITPKKVASFSIAAFALVFLSFWAVSYLGQPGKVAETPAKRAAV